MDEAKPVIEITALRRKDKRKAVDWAIEGMKFDRYFTSKRLTRLFGYYFWYDTCTTATRMYGAYLDGTCVGVMINTFAGEPKPYSTWFGRTFVRIFQWRAMKKYPEDALRYHQTNEEMYQEAFGNNPPDGSIDLLAADPHSTVRGIGTALLNELIRTDAGKAVYLNTDGDCTYQFYEHRGFERVNTRNIMLKYGDREVPLVCYLYARKL
ncbi:MAG TPA: GNAT family N-acetyltransferase [Methanocorpusculum sp.]|nr:GNAT family N-acetyltransferase [Methanocorpusculum sp.]